MSQYKSDYLQIFLISIYVFACLFFISCGNQNGGGDEVKFGNPIIEIHLDKISDDRNAEISGLTWYGDDLILLPQYPDRYQSGTSGALFSISKKEIINYLDKKSPLKLTLEKIEFNDQSVVKMIPGFQGYEAIIFVGDKVYLTIESRNSGKMSSFLVSGKMSDPPRRILLDPNRILKLELPEQIWNMSFESLLNIQDKIIAIFEMNGSNVNANPVALVIDSKTEQIDFIPFPKTEYRLTDATSPDINGHFWVTNYYWPGDFGISNPGEDLLISGQTNQRVFDKNKGVERIVELKYSKSGIEHAPTSPIYLETKNDGSGRNWEGIVRLDDRGFLIVTDKHPATIFAFVPF